MTNNISVVRHRLKSFVAAQTALVTLSVAASTVIAATHSSSATAKSPDWELVPPPPPSQPILQVPPPPVMVPYTYAERGGPSLPEQEAATALMMPFNPPAIVRPKPPQPQPQPRPTGLRPANSPNLSTVYAISHGFGAPRTTDGGSYGPGAAEAFPSVSAAAPVNTWFDSSLRWYAQKVNAQQFYTHMISRPEYGIPNTGYAAALDAVAQQPYAAPPPVAQPTPHHTASRHHGRRHGHRVFASR